MRKCERGSRKADELQANKGDLEEAPEVPELNVAGVETPGLEHRACWVETAAENSPRWLKRRVRVKDTS